MPTITDTYDPSPMAAYDSGIRSKKTAPNRIPEDNASVYTMSASNVFLFMTRNTAPKRESKLTIVTDTSA